MLSVVVLPQDGITVKRYKVSYATATLAPFCQETGVEIAAETNK